MSVHESKDADAMRDVDIATNVQAVASGMEWDNEERKQAASAATAGQTEAAQQPSLGALRQTSS